MDTLRGEIEGAVEAWDRRGWPRPEAALVSGSGLAVDLGRPIVDPIPLQELLPFPVAGILGHPLRVDLLEPQPGRRLLYYRGRVHAYQGHTGSETVFQIRLAARLGAKVVLLTNAAGGLRPESQKAGDLWLIRDHLNLTGMNPLFAAQLPAEWGPMFPEMTGAYDDGLRALAKERAAALGIALGEGVYVGLSGPSYETPAEVAMLRTLGGDLVGMSTVLEVIAARHMGVRCFALSLVTNLAANAGGTHEEVLEMGRLAAERVQRLFGSMLADPRLFS
jgi:purine-nucleoside phosphorylase